MTSGDVPRLIPPELRANLRRDSTAEVIARHDHEIPAAPDPALAGLCTHLEDLSRQALDCWRIDKMLEVADAGGGEPGKTEGLDFIRVAQIATGRIAQHLADAHVLTLSRSQAASLPELSSEETHFILTSERLPWEITWIEIAARPIGCPLVIRVKTREGAMADGHFVGALCRQLSGGIEVSPMLALDASPELCCPTATQYGVGVVAPGELGVALCSRDEAGELVWHCSTEPEADGSAAVEMAAACADYVAAALMVLSAVNVDHSPRELTGKRLKRWRREHHPLPHVIEVRPRPGHIGQSSSNEGGDLVGSHMVRGHWMHFTKGPVFNAHPEARRFVPGLGREAVRIWRGAHVRGQREGAPTPTIVQLSR